VAQEFVERAAFHGIVSQIAVLGIAFQQPLALRETTDTLGDGVCQMRQLGTARRLHPTKSRARSVRAIDVDAIEKKYAEVDIQIELTTESLNQRHGTGAPVDCRRVLSNAPTKRQLGPRLSVAAPHRRLFTSQ
jgi:hypothetical protein